ncbi:MAG TPA: MarR family winged helix-turn-helix transcriptional regulator [Longimicrobiales bacterium]
MSGDGVGGLDRAGNLLGALSLAVVDRTFDAIAEAGGESETAAVALSALYHFLDRPTIDGLRRVLGLTSSGTVRLVDRLEAAGWVKRGPAADGRATTVLLTASGRRIAERVSAARASALERALSVLSPAERRQFEELASILLVGLMRGPGAVRWLCRLCDMGACGWASGGCPVRNAVRE